MIIRGIELFMVEGSLGPLARRAILIVRASSAGWNRVRVNPSMREANDVKGVRAAAFEP